MCRAFFLKYSHSTKKHKISFKNNTAIYYHTKKGGFHFVKFERKYPPKEEIAEPKIVDPSDPDSPHHVFEIPSQKTIPFNDIGPPSVEP